MIFVTMVALALAGAPEQPKLAAPGFSVLGVSPETGKFYSEDFAQQLAQHGLSVVTAQQIQAMIGFERQKALMNCSESSCAAELANALGVDALVTGQIGKPGSTFQINISIIAARDGQLLATHSARVKNEDEVLEDLERAAREMAPEVQRKLGRAPGAAVAAPPGTSSATHPAVAGAAPAARKAAPSGSGWLWPAVGGGVLLAGGGLALYYAQSEAALLNGASSEQPIDLSVANQHHVLGLAADWGGGGMLALGAVGIGAAAWMLFSPAPVTLAIVPAPGGAAVSFSGVLP